MAELGTVVALIKSMSGADPAVIEQAVQDWLDNHPEATTTVQDGSITEAKLAQDVLADLAEIPELKEAIADILVENTAETATLTNSVQLGNINARYGLTKTSSSGVSPLVFKTNGNDANPTAMDQTVNEQDSKWLIGLKAKVTKNNAQVGDPSSFRIANVISGSNKNLFPFDVIYGEWVNYAVIVQNQLKSVQFNLIGYETAPGDNDVIIEIKDYYIYDVTGLSDNLIDYVKNQQNTNFTDGTVTYSTGGGGSSELAPDTTLTIAGKVPDSKAVGDAIANAVKAPLDKSLNGVAFGTSLTSRTKNGNPGYLSYLQELIGIDFDNQGVGSAQIKSSILNAIKEYTGYASKKVCIIEGFVNDWKFDSVLGTWKDDTENSACGCLRSAINYIMSQNANITLFIVFDHYGRNYSSDDRSSTAENTANLTQYEYYEELAKVAESLGIPVIKQYAGSQISENTPQYLYDYIHCNELGAKQSAYFIYSQMKQYFQNQQSNS